MFSIRKANQADFSDIANIHFISWNAAYLNILPKSYINEENNLSEKVEMWERVIAHPGVTVLVAYDGSHDNKHKIVGFIGYFNKGSEYEITTLYVLPDYQCLGIGTQLMNAVLKTIWNTDYSPSLYLWVLKDNVSAINFYKKHGFIHSGESSKTLYNDTEIVDIKMIKNSAY